MARVTQEEIQKINELYLVYGTYSAVAKEVGRAPSTVKKYVDPNFKSTCEIKEPVEVNWDPIFTAPPIDIFAKGWEE